MDTADDHDEGRQKNKDTETETKQKSHSPPIEQREISFFRFCCYVIFHRFLPRRISSQVSSICHAQIDGTSGEWKERIDRGLKLGLE